MKLVFALLAVFFGILIGGNAHAYPVFSDDSGFGTDGSYIMSAEAGICEGDIFHIIAETALDTSRVDIVFCIDTTGSMFSSHAVTKARNILLELLSRGYDVNFGLITFGDEYNITDFNPSLPSNQLGSSIIDFNLRSTTIGFDGFGEVADRNIQLDAMSAAITSYDWRTNAVSIVYLFTDSPFHQRGDGSGLSFLLPHELYSLFMSTGVICFAQFNTADSEAAAFYNNLIRDTGGMSYPLSAAVDAVIDDLLSHIRIFDVMSIRVRNFTDSPMNFLLMPDDPSCLHILSPNPIATDMVYEDDYGEGSWRIGIDEECDGLFFHIRVNASGVNEMYRFYINSDGIIASEPCISWFPDDTCVEVGDELGVSLFGFFALDTEIPDYATITIDGIDRTDECRAHTSYEGTSLLLPSLEEGRSYNVCIELLDETLISGPYCNDFTICERVDTTGDLCSPAIVWETSSTRCLRIWQRIFIQLLDVYTTDCTLQTGIDTLSLEVLVNGYPVEVGRGGPPLPPGPIYDLRVHISVADIPIEFLMMPFTVQVAVRDMAGNYTVDSRSYSVCPIDIDSLPPVISWFGDDDSISVRDTIYAYVYDSLVIPYSGIARDSLLVTYRECGEIFPPLSWAFYDIVEVSRDSFMVKIYGDTEFRSGCHEFCIQAYDHAGNVTVECREFEFFYPPIDTFPPCLVYTSPASGDTVRDTTGIELLICDNCPIYSYDWWVDPTTVHVRVNGDLVPTLVSAEDSAGCNGYRVVMNADPLIEEGVYEVCVRASDFYSNDLHECFDFTILYGDTIAPCVSWFGHRPPFYTDDLIDVLIDGFCGDDDASPLNVSSLVVTMGRCGETPDILNAGRDYHIYGISHDSVSISLRPIGGFEPGCRTICVSISDYAGNTTIECIDVDVIDADFTLSGFSRIHNKTISCADYCIDLDYTGIVPDSFYIMIDSTVYTEASVELTYHDDIIRFCPVFWIYTEGNHYLYTDYGSAIFTIDYSSPYISRSFPSAGDTIDASNDSIVFYINDLYSDINGDSILVVLGGTRIRVGTYGARYIWSESKFILDEIPESFFTPGSSVEMWFHVHDMIDICAPNYIDTNWTFYVREIIDTIPRYYINATVTDMFGTLLSNVIISLYDYYGLILPIAEFEDVSSDITFEVEPGMYSLAALDPLSRYEGRFYNNRSNPLEADPIVIHEPGTTFVELRMPEIDMGRYFSVSGRVSIVDEGVDRCYVIAISSDEVEDEFSVADRTDIDGNFEIWLPNGEYLLFAFRGDHVPSFFGDVPFWVDADTIVVSGEPLHGIDIDLSEASTEEGDSEIIVNVFEVDTGQVLSMTPLRGARLYLYNEETPVVFVTVSDYLGRGYFQDIPAGHYNLFADKVGYFMSETPEFIVLSAGDIVETDVNLIYSILEETRGTVPDRFDMTISPNPFNARTKVSFNLIEQGIVSLHLISVNGRVLRSYELGNLAPGTHSFILNPYDLPTGLYLLGFELSGSVLSHRKLLLLK